ncbi:MAG: sulfotransferase [Sphingomonadaceae bacterium]
MESDTTNQTERLVARMRSAQAIASEDFDAAKFRLEQLISDAPSFLPARRLLAHILREHGQVAQATTIELETVSIGIARPTFQVAESAFLSDNLESAERLVRAHLREDPEDPAAALLLGEIAARCNAVQEAANLFNRAILFSPSYLKPRMALAKLQRDNGRYQDALTTLDGILAIEPTHLPSLSLKASVYEQLREFEKADATFTLLHQLHPDDARGWANHAFLLKTIGRRKDAILAYRAALSIDPSLALAWWGLSNLKTVRFDANDAAAMRKALTKADLKSADRVNLLYALGKALHDQGDYAAAFSAYAEGAELRLSRVPYDPQKVQDHVTKSRATCTADFFAGRTGWGCRANDPIFIVSLPRSGSTLVEQILASHPLVEGTEELHDIERIALSLDPGGETGGWLDVLPQLSRKEIEGLGQHYMDATRRFRHTDRPRFTDKMPSNWVFLGLIRAALPNAKVIDIRRHPMGCGFANFSQHFNWGINFSYSLEHIGGFYSAYLRQMAHFERSAPGWIHHISYEQLIEDTEGEIRKLLNYLDLPFDEACLRFYENRRAVYTPSSEQVRSPINREGMERWKRYEAFLEPLRQSLGSVLDHYPAVPPELDY